jgi:hypothetical protein
MIDILYNKLGSLNDAYSLAEWKDVVPEIFNRHSQHSHIPTPPTLSIPTPQPKQSPDNKKNTAKNTAKDTAKNTAKNTAKDTAKNTAKDTAKNTTIKPIAIIMNETTSFPNTAEYIKESIITLISKEEFSKIFGMTKCAEIMSGIVNNRWNKSTALFISFFLDKEVYYNEKVIVYNKEKNKGRITI